MIFTVASIKRPLALLEEPRPDRLPEITPVFESTVVAGADDVKVIRRRP
jgi:hypothetical protein